MENKLYLIHEEDYVKHIKEKAELFLLLQNTIQQILELQPNRNNKDLIMSAMRLGCHMDSFCALWNIPAGYGSDGLRELMENELIAPEEAGYYTCDDPCCCQCGCCCDNCDLYDDDEDYDDEDYDDYDEDDPDEDDEESFAEMIAGLSSIVQSIFGDNVSLHIVVE